MTGTLTAVETAAMRATSYPCFVPSRSQLVSNISPAPLATADHFADGLAHGADAVLAASIFHYGEFTVSQMKEELAKRNIPVRI
eukprot:TRINITY_DN3816_c0_g1_i1.p2 TRINITY_DN3816_c0_g1~~TRINITY_DN3816_c0_g1_i1.p2  ORF type:complete len:84 (-),score=21.59 TRINITY_DN3816_c0_g1_i1:29-280(-)